MKDLTRSTLLAAPLALLIYTTVLPHHGTPAWDALDAFTQGDAQLARAVIERDDEIDVLYNRIFHDLIDLMMTEPDTTPRGARLLFVAKHIERIGDYVTDICELTVYMAEASIIKHTN